MRRGHRDILVCSSPWFCQPEPRFGQSTPPCQRARARPTARARIWTVAEGMTACPRDRTGRPHLLRSPAIAQTDPRRLFEPPGEPSVDPWAALPRGDVAPVGTGVAASLDAPARSGMEEPVTTTAPTIGAQTPPYPRANVAHSDRPESSGSVPHKSSRGQIRPRLGPFR